MMPWSFWAQQYILGIIAGGTVFSIEGQQCVIQSKFKPQFQSPALYNPNGEFSDVWNYFIKPFMYAVISENLIPSRQEIENMIYLNIIQTNFTNFTNSQEQHGGWVANTSNLGLYQQYFNATYYYRNNTGMLTELIPNTARYFMIPLTPVGKKLNFNCKRKCLVK